MLRLARSRDGRLALGVLTGRFDTDQVLREVARAYRMGDLAPGCDSVVVYDPGVVVGHVAVADLVAIRDCVARHEGTLDAGPPYRGILVAAEREAQIVSNVYAATWRAAGLPLPDHRVVATLEEAEVMLDCGPLAEEIDVLRPVPLVRYLA
ncbi:MAG: hypothetical protein HLUCCA09_02470 [Rhodobacteraceae bacterium HLUCCA09]|nr:MAG: hypothetical protein HLUCCA09_02470 [Rhodobacteraceae bacterium HLUCCA09]